MTAAVLCPACLVFFVLVTPCFVPRGVPVSKILGMRLSGAGFQNRFSPARSFDAHLYTVMLRAAVCTSLCVPRCFAVLPPCFFLVGSVPILPWLASPFGFKFGK